MPQAYARRKRGEEESAPILRGMDEVLKSTYGTTVYQEQTMAIGVEAMGFNMNQADTLIRKTFAKKKLDKMEMLRRIMKYGKIKTNGPKGWHDNPKMPWYDPDGKMGPAIDGGIKYHGYTEEEMDDFWNNIKGCASYLFNKSHAAAYSFISACTAHLKCYYPTQFYAAVLSMQTEDEKIQRYIKVAEDEDIIVKVPDINDSEISFTPKDKTILYGLGSIKGVGAKVLNPLIEGRPYKSLSDMYERLPKKVLNKTVIVALAKSGALECFGEENRCAVLQDIRTLRKDKDEYPYQINDWNEATCIQFETETLSAPITYKPWWNTIKAEAKISKEPATILEYREHCDKNGNMMAFAKLNINHCNIETVIFASVYTKHVDCFDCNLNPNKNILVSGRKDGKEKLIVSAIYKAA